MSGQRAPSTAQIAAPPRETGDPIQDARALVVWIRDFYNVTVRETGLLDPSYQASGGGVVDAANLPDPAATTLAQAQATANEAFKLAVKQAAALGSFTLDGTNNYADVTFTEPLKSADYVVLLQLISTSGGPTPTDVAVASVVKETTKFRVTVAAYPGAGKSVTYDYAAILKG